MEHHPPTGQDPGGTGSGITRIPTSNAITAAIIAIAALAAGITVLMLTPGVLEGLGSAVTITGGGFTLAAKIAVPR
ncbi:hypothetical protein SAMN06272735_3937 [Streptomyces sp. TLI_55]|uniref:hypothetical protein n=1 Tax=Streptomyces sp. TLI_55 TaxID=1938861 RepID=UPI000BD792EE|nr:hypothetical protein [Streptomyces sp. TLI_55]SNX62181.1 hypothetical protein SAMN06272735_3937 [Streptomyces sp. TLI_55]